MADPIELCRYQYDALDRLVARAPLSEALAQRFYKGDSLATELQGAERYTILRTGNQLLAHKNQFGIALLGTDLQNSVLHADDMAIAYAPYGHREKIDVLPGLPGFNGEQPDPVTGHYLLGNGYRAYNPVLMRFNSTDSLSPFGSGGLNTYNYCLGDPINRTDPTGHLSWQAGVGLGLSAFGILASIATFGAATPLAIAGLTTGLASGAAGVAQAFTEKSSPEASSVLGWVGLGLGVASAGFGVAAGFQKVGNRAVARFYKSGGLSGRGAVSAAKQMSGMGQFQPFESMPDVLENIVRRLSSNDLIALSATSSQMNEVVNSALTPVSKVLGSIDQAASLEGNADLIRRTWDIASGKSKGMVPAQLSRAGINPREIPHVKGPDGIPSLSAMEERYDYLEATRSRQISLRNRWK